MKNIIIVLFLSIYTFSFSQQTEKLNKPHSIKEKIDYFLKVTDTLRIDGKNPGMAFAIVYENKLIYKGVFGYRNRERKLPVTDNTLFEIGSLTKAFTGVIASQLVEQNKLNWNDRIVKYIPEFKLQDTYATKNTTLKDIFTHRVGLDKHYFLMYGPKYERDKLINKLQFMSFKSTFREKYIYNNFMYTVAGIFEERATNKSWEELVKKEIFEPLGMNNSYTTFNEFQNYNENTTSYNNDGITIIPNISLDTYAPAGGISSTINDMSKWLIMLTNSGTLNEKEFLTEKQFNYLTSPLTVKNAKDNSFYGIGWDIGQDIIYHDGSTAGQRSRIIIQPKKGFGIVILTNQQSSIQNLLGHYASKIFLEDNFNRLMNFENILKSRAEFAETKLETYIINDNSILKQIKCLEGNYNHPAYGTIEITKGKKNEYLFKYYDFKGTIKHNKELNFTAFVNHFTGKDKFDFEILKGENNKIKGLKVSISYSEPLIFKKN